MWLRDWGTRNTFQALPPHSASSGPTPFSAAKGRLTNARPLERWP